MTDKKSALGEAYYMSEMIRKLKEAVRLGYEKGRTDGKMVYKIKDIADLPKVFVDEDVELFVNETAWAINGEEESWHDALWRAKDEGRRRGRKDVDSQVLRYVVENGVLGLTEQPGSGWCSKAALALNDGAPEGVIRYFSVVDTKDKPTLDAERSEGGWGYNKPAFTSIDDLNNYAKKEGRSFTEGAMFKKIAADVGNESASRWHQEFTD